MQRFIAFLVMSVTVLAAGCIDRIDVGPTRTDTQSVELGQAETAQVTIRMGVGELDVRGGSDNLLDALFTYNIDHWKPELDYEVNGSRGVLEVRQPAVNVEGIPDNDVDYQWELQLSDNVPMDMDVELGVGQSVLNLSGLQLRALTMKTGVGETTVDLSGDWAESFPVNVDAGIGKLVLVVPQEVGVVVSVSTGLGDQTISGLTRQGNEYVNEAYGRSDVTISITLNGGIGEIEVRQAD